MASRKIETDLDDIEAEYENDSLDDAEEMEYTKLRQTIAQFKGDGGGQMHIYRMDNYRDKKAGQWLDSWSVSDYSYDELMVKLRDEFGGGIFKIQIRDDKGALRMNQKASVISPPEKEEKTKDNGNNDIVTLIATMNKSSEEASRRSEQNLNAFMQMMMKTQVDASQSQSNMLIKMMELQNNKPTSEPFGAKEMLAMMTSLKALQPEQKDPMEILIQGMQLGRESGGGDENMLQTAIKTLGGPLAEMTKGLGAMTAPRPMAQQPPQPAPQTGNAPPQNFIPLEQPVVSNNAPAQISDTGDAEKMKLMQLLALKPQLEMLLNAAAQNKNPELYAELLVDQVGPEKTINLLADNELYEKLFSYVPEAAKVRPWFDQVRATVLQWANDTDDDDDDAPDDDSPNIPATPEPPQAPTE